MDDFITKMTEYDNMFEDGLPTEPLSSKYNESEMVEIMDRCIKERKDVFELGYITEQEVDEY